ncbi:hypothetical protein MHU86_9513 [Fragilaria crotonensis]|nr:hypothetical protein MHU86_9513 [Fragilaria crotonensis]
MIRSLLRLRLCFSNQEEETQSNALVEGTIMINGDSPVASTTTTSNIDIHAVRFTIPKYKIVSRRSCPLLKFLWDRDWPRVVQRIESHPQESCCLTELSLRSALHLASFNHGCPLDVAEAVLLANVHALYMEDSSTLTPLHYACSFYTGTDHLVPLFCRKLEEMDMQFAITGQTPPLLHTSNSRRSPLLLACSRNAPISVLCALLTASSSVGSTNQWICPTTGGEPYWYNVQDFGIRALSPLATLVDQYLDVETVTQTDYHDLREHLQLNSCSFAPFQDFELGQDKETISVLRKVNLLMEHTLEEYDGSALHIACSLKVSIPSLAAILGAVLPEQATIYDNLGYIPLHHVLLNPHSPLQLLCNVLDINRDACTIPTSNGTFPLILAIQQGWRWEQCISELVRASPTTLDTADTETGLVPFLLAASVNADVTTIFELLRVAPHQLMCAPSPNGSACEV